MKHKRVGWRSVFSFRFVISFYRRDPYFRKPRKWKMDVAKELCRKNITKTKLTATWKCPLFFLLPFVVTLIYVHFKDLTSFHVKKGLKWLNYILLLLKLTTTIVTLDDSYLLSVAKKAIISAAILQQSAERLCEDEHLVLTRWPLVFFTTEGSSESEKNQIWKKRKKMRFNLKGHVFYVGGT